MWRDSVNRKTKLGIFVGLIFIIIMFIIQTHNNKFQNTFEERNNFIKKSETGAVIISETIIDNYIVSEIVAGNKYGYAVFAPYGNDKYSWQSMLLTEEEIYSETILINSNTYEILMCEKSNLDYVETVYSNTDNGETISSTITELDGKTFAVQKAPDLKSYTYYVTWYDTSGKQYSK